MMLALIIIIGTALLGSMIFAGVAARRSQSAATFSPGLGFTQRTRAAGCFPASPQQQPAPSERRARRRIRLHRAFFS